MSRQPDSLTLHNTCVRTVLQRRSRNANCFVLCFSFQLDADRDEEEVFCDISMTLDNKLFPSEEPVAGEMKQNSLENWTGDFALLEFYCQ